jgi:intracellular sulfur oxidation DsrE/DsrF family protein
MRARLASPGVASTLINDHTMKKFIPLVAILLFVACSASAQKAPYQVVIDVTSSDTLVHQMVVRWLGEITAHPEAQVEVVFYAQSLDMVTQGRSVVANGLRKYFGNPNVALNVCEVAMKNKHIAKDQLLTGVSTVPDGIYEIVQRQHEGWGYIKAAR